MHEDKLESRVKGVKTWVSSFKWLLVAGIKCEGIKVGKGNIQELNDYNKITFYRSCLQKPQGIMRGFQVGELTLITRLVAFFIVWILTPKGHNHAVLHEEDLILMYCIINREKVNWAYGIREQMEKAERLADYKLLYVILVSKFIEHYEVPLEGELTELVKQSYEVSKTNVHKIGLTQVNNGQWVCQADAAKNAEGRAAAEDGEMETNEQRTNREFYTAHFQHLDLQIEVVQDQLNTMVAWNEPHE